MTAALPALLPELLPCTPGSCQREARMGEMLGCGAASAASSSSVSPPPLVDASPTPSPQRNVLSPCKMEFRRTPGKVGGEDTTLNSPVSLCVMLELLTHCAPGVRTANHTMNELRLAEADCDLIKQSVFGTPVLPELIPEESPCVVLPSLETPEIQPPLPELTETTPEPVPLPDLLEASPGPMPALTATSPERVALPLPELTEASETPERVLEMPELTEASPGPLPALMKSSPGVVVALPELLSASPVPELLSSSVPELLSASPVAAVSMPELVNISPSVGVLEYSFVGEEAREEGDVSAELLSLITCRTTPVPPQSYVMGGF